MLHTACKHFPGIRRDLVTLQTNQLHVCGSYYAAEIGKDVARVLSHVNYSS